MNSSMQITQKQMHEFSKCEGVIFLGAVPIEKEPQYRYFKKWISDKKHAGMSFLERNSKLREDPSLFNSECNNALIFAFNYFQGDRYGGIKTVTKPKIAQYARFRDYHKLLKIKAGNIVKKLCDTLSLDELPHRILIDSAPVLERPLAQRTGAGFIGKNTVFISPKLGSYLLLFEIFVKANIELSNLNPIESSKRSENGGCGTCRRCQVNCPSGALTEDYVLDARKCIAYYTIEHRDIIPVEFWDYLKLYYFGCDICQLVCPYNRNIESSKEINAKVNDDLDLYSVALMDQSDYESWFGGTPMTRAKINGLKRNALIYLIVTNDPRLNDVIAKLKGRERLVDQTIDQIDEYKRFKNSSSIELNP